MDAMDIIRPSRRLNSAIVVFYMVILPGLILLALSSAHVNIREAGAAIICGGTSVGVYYISRRWFDSSSEMAVALGIGSMTFSVLFGVTMTGVTDGNPYDYVAPYLGAFSVWAVATIMWLEARWFAEKREADDRYSEELIESAGFGVALLYTAIYVLIDLYGRGDDSASKIFFGFLLMWFMFRFFFGFLYEAAEDVESQDGLDHPSIENESE